MGFQENSFYTLHLCLTKILQNVQNYTKIDSWLQKSPEEFGQLQTSTRKFKELKFDGILLSKNKFVQKYIASAKTLYTECLPFNYLCGNPQSYLSLYHFLQHSSSVFFYLKYMISTKVAHQVQIFRLSAARVKVHQIPHVIFQTKSQFFFKVWISFQCHER